MSVDHYKVLFTGPVGAGKTTAIRSISDNLPMMTDVHATDETRDRKPSTTVAMDYGVIRIGPHRGGAPLRHTGPGALRLHVGNPAGRCARVGAAGRQRPP